MWLPDDEELPEDCMQQARNLANLPVARKWIAVMPDCHLGYGMPIGGVLATRDAVVPNAVGVDIGCGMIAVRINNLSRAELSPEVLQSWRVETHKRVPVGMASHQHPQGIPEGLNPMKVFFEGSVSWGLSDLIARQVGTLGGGNHFIELQYDEATEEVWLMLHSGSRGLGKTICDFYHTRAKAYMQEFHTALPDLDLSFLPKGTSEFQNYIDEMEFAMRFAEANRQAMFEATMDALSKVLGRSAGCSDLVDTHHNFARMEHHYGENLMVHRKGAVHAKGRVTIPGSMGTASYIGLGLQNAESFETCSHGAGRLLGRKAANRTITREQAEESMHGVVFGIRDGDFDEMPAAYKDVHAVMAAQSDLVEPVVRLRPLAVVKG
jgi:tRNA-splicing ligase RtcB